MSQDKESIKKSRRKFLRNAGMLSLAASPLGALAKIDTSEGITFAAGPRPLVRYPGKRALTLVHSRPPHLETHSPFLTKASSLPMMLFLCVII